MRVGQVVIYTRSHDLNDTTLAWVHDENADGTLKLGFHNVDGLYVVRDNVPRREGKDREKDGAGQTWAKI